MLGSAWYDTCISLSPGVVGAVIGTLVFFQARKRQARKRLAAAIGGRDLPIGLLENSVALGGVVSIALAAVRPARGSPVGLSK